MFSRVKQRVLRPFDRIIAGRHSVGQPVVAKRMRQGAATASLLGLSGCIPKIEHGLFSTPQNVVSSATTALSNHFAEHPIMTTGSLFTLIVAGGLVYASNQHASYFDEFKARLWVDPVLADGLTSSEIPLRNKCLASVKELNRELKVAQRLIDDLLEKAENHSLYVNKPSKTWGQESKKYREFFRQTGKPAIPLLLKTVAGLQKWFSDVALNYPQLFSHQSNTDLSIDFENPEEFKSDLLLQIAANRSILFTFLEILAEWDTAETRKLFGELKNFDFKGHRPVFNFWQRNLPYFTDVGIVDVRELASKTIEKFEQDTTTINSRSFPNLVD